MGGVDDEGSFSRPPVVALSSVFIFRCSYSLGKGAVFGYDAVGSYERVPYVVTGSGSALMTSIFDNQVRFESALSLPILFVVNRDLLFLNPQHSFSSLFWFLSCRSFRLLSRTKKRIRKN
jgi:hypothetical protein